MSYNSLGGSIPNLPSNIKYVIMAGNSLSGNISEALGNLINVKQIDLSYNELTGQVRDVII